jgi:hypothetical protein
MSAQRFGEAHPHGGIFFCFLVPSIGHLEPLECDEAPPVRRAERVSAPPEVVERSLFSLGLSCTFNNLQVADGCANPSSYVQVRPIMGCIVGCG